MDAYGHLSKMYDFLMDDVDYSQWVDYLDAFIKKHYSSAEHILELACGTGNITLGLAEKGYRVDAVDISDEMLTVAQGKLKNHMGKVRFIHSDMLDLDLNKKYDVVVCLCDGLNYIVELDEIKALFNTLGDLLNDSGLFIFDISSEYKLSTILGDTTYAENFDDFSYIWENYYDPETRVLEFDFTIFQKENNTYSKHHEYHTQRAHQECELIKLLKENGFDKVLTYHEITEEKVKNNSERIHFVSIFGGEK